MKKRKDNKLSACFITIFVITAIAVCLILYFFKSKAVQEKTNEPEPESLTKTEETVSPEEQNPDSIYHVDLASEGVKLSKELYGTFIEDINYAADGGLYAELVQNRSFEFFPMESNRNDKNAHFYAWSNIGSADTKIFDTDGMNEKNTHWIQLTANVSGDGISNSGYDGIAITCNEPYRISFYTRGTYDGSYQIQLASETSVFAEITLSAEPSEEWTKLTGYLTVNENAGDARLNIVLSKAGTVDMDMISLFPVHTYNNRENGLRADIVAMLKELNPGFLRFPGGCIVEGESLENAYNWKDSVGDISERATIFNRWRRSGASGYYYQSYGLGFYEYFTLCEDLGCEPIPCLNAGISCYGPQYASMKSMQQYIDDAIDLIEFANGDPKTNEWAALRAQMGHPEPFNMRYLEIGNEQIGDSRYYERFELFEQQIHEKYPEILLISSVGGLSNGMGTPTATWLTGKGREFVYANDEHFYESADWFLSNTCRYDSMPRNNDAYIFAGEYACHYNEMNPLYNAICEAAYMTGFERNGDIVKLTCYAPLLCKIGYTQWRPNLIWFNNQDVYGTPSYWAAHMYAVHLGDRTFSDSVTSFSEDEPLVSGKIGVASWNTIAEYDNIKVVDNTSGKVLYETDFAHTGLDGWSNGTGGWAIENNTLRQTDVFSSNNALHTGDISWTNYTYTLRARKLSGSEGFIIPFLVQDESNYYHLNLGGWGNSYSAVEQAVRGIKTLVGTSDFIVENNVWYNIKIVVDQTSLQCYIDNKLIISTRFPAKQPIYTTASEDEETGDIILKIVNSTKEENQIQIHLDHSEGRTINPVAEKTVLTHELLNAINAMVNKENVIPAKSRLKGISEQFTINVPAYSVTVLRIHTKPDNEVVQRAITINLESAPGSMPNLPKQVEVIFADGSKGTKEVIWDYIADSLCEFEGVYEIKGSIDGINGLAKAVVEIKK